MYLYVTTYTAAIICFIRSQWATISETTVHCHAQLKSCPEWGLLTGSCAAWRSLGLHRAQRKAARATRNEQGKQISWGSWCVILPGIFTEWRKQHVQILNSLMPKALEGCSEKGVLVEIQLASQKGKQCGQKCTLSKSLAKPKLRAVADWTSSRASSTGTLMNLNRNLMKFGKKESKGLHLGRITPCSAQALLWRAWACSRSQADHEPQRAHMANLAGRYWSPSGVWSVDQGSYSPLFQAAPEILRSALRAEP